MELSIHKMPLITTQNWSIHNLENGELLWGNNANQRLEIASLTKIMTAYLSLELS